MDIAQFPTEVTKALAWPFDFDIRGIPLNRIWFAVVPAIDMVPIARDGTGGIFARLNDCGDIPYVDSEGSGGVIALNLDALILLFVCHPYWKDILTFSGGGKLAEMRRTLPFAERDHYGAAPGARKLGALIRGRLGLPHTTDLVDILHPSVSSSQDRSTLIAPDGSRLGSLFNTFTVDRNPGWRRV